MAGSNYIRFRDAEEDRKVVDQFNRHFKERTGLDWPEDPSQWAYTLSLAGFTPAEIRELHEGPVPEFYAHTPGEEFHPTLTPMILGQLERRRAQAHRERLFPKGVPEDPDLFDAIVKLETERAPGNRDIDILRDFTGETSKDDPKAKRLQNRIRKARLDGRTSLPPRRKRTKRTV